MLLTASLTTEIVNPLIESTIDAFSLMMDVSCRKRGLSLKQRGTALYPISAVIGLTGRIAGTLCLNVSQVAAFNIVKRMVDIDVSEVNRLVCDSIGEFSNVIAGSAKDRVAQLELEISIPTIIQGVDHNITFPSDCQPICVDFDSDVGPFRILFGFVER